MHWWKIYNENNGCLLITDEECIEFASRKRQLFTDGNIVLKGVKYMDTLLHMY